MKKITTIFLRSLLGLFLLINIIVIFQAYKLTHFYNPGEVAYKAQKDKAGREIVKEILFGINASKKPNAPPDPGVVAVDLFTKDSLKLSAWYRQVPAAKGTVALFHGHGGNKSDVIAEAHEFNKIGYNTLQLDFRAHGSSEGNTCTVGYYESGDVTLAYDYIKWSGEKNIILWGISLGAATITKAIHDDSIAPQKIILEMPFGSLPDAVAGRLRMMHLPPQPLATMLTFWGGTLHGFWAFGLKPEVYAKDIKCPVLLQWGLHDQRVTESETNIIYKNITASKKLVTYTSAGHESLYKKEPGKWTDEVSAFLLR